MIIINLFVIASVLWIKASQKDKTKFQKAHITGLKLLIGPQDQIRIETALALTMDYLDLVFQCTC